MLSPIDRSLRKVWFCCKSWEMMCFNTSLVVYCSFSLEVDKLDVEPSAGSSMLCKAQTTGMLCELTSSMMFTARSRSWCLASKEPRIVVKEHSGSVAHC